MQLSRDRWRCSKIRRMSSMFRCCKIRNTHSWRMQLILVTRSQSTFPRASSVTVSKGRSCTLLVHAKVPFFFGKLVQVCHTSKIFVDWKIWWKKPVTSLFFSMRWCTNVERLLLQTIPSILSRYFCLLGIWNLTPRMITYYFSENRLSF